MVQVRMQKENEQPVVGFYTKLRNLLLSGQKIEAERLFDSMLKMPWQDLLHYAMIRRNCPVSILIMKRVIAKERLTRKELHEDVSRISQGVSRDFAERISKKIDSDQFDVEFERYSRVQKVVHTQLRSRTGKGLLNPNKFSSKKVNK